MPANSARGLKTRRAQVGALVHAAVDLDTGVLPGQAAELGDALEAVGAVAGHRDSAPAPAFLRGTDGPGWRAPCWSTASPGNGVVETHLFDQRYHPTAITAVGATGLLDWSYTTDPVGNVTLIDELTPPNQDRTYGYQDQQYFLTSGSGPWGAQSWTYDRIGNRLTESDSTAPALLTYTYQLNGLSQNTPLLDRITPAPGNSGTGMLDYGYDAAGNQTTITASGGELFGTDTLSYSEESRLAALATDYGNAQAAITYDGRGFLHRSQLTYTNSPDFLIAEPTYGSEGLLYSRRSVRERTRKDPETGQGPETTDETSDIFYFAGRPIAQRTTSNVAKPSLLYFTTDHLGTPILATDATGGAVWQGGFEPFGGAFTFLGGTKIFLRFPGQWEDPSWEVSGRVAGLSYNVYRWYENATGRYTRPDPWGVDGSGLNVYLYGGASPLINVDLDGRFIPRACKPDDLKWCQEQCQKRRLRFLGCNCFGVPLCFGLFDYAVAACKEWQKGCSPCPAPPPPEIHRVPPKKPHFPCKGDHWHYFRYDQGPPPQCICRLSRVFGGCLD